MKKILILAGADVHNKIVMAAKAMGLHTIVTDYLRPEDAPAKLLADEYWMLNITDTDAIVDRCKAEGVDAVLAYCIDPAQLPYQCVCERLGLPCYGTKRQFDILTQKRLFKDYCRDHGVGIVPEYTLADINGDTGVSVRYPLLVKPSESRGSRGQTVCHNREETIRAIALAQKESGDGKALIERYMLGVEDIGMAYAVIGGEPYLVKMADRILGAPEDSLERQQIASVLPSVHAEEFRLGDEPAVKAMIKSLGIEFGAVFLQGFWEDGHILMYDPGLRFPGSDFDLVVRDTTGFDAMSSFVKFAVTGDKTSCVGDPTDAYKMAGETCLILSIACRPGTIAKFEGLEEIGRMEGVLSVSQRYRVGETVPASGDVRQRVAEFIVRLPDRDAARAFVSKVYDTLVIQDADGHDLITSKVHPAAI